MRTTGWDETWHRLREWTSGQGPSERLAAQMLLSEGFSELDPSHPLGGKDGGKDATCIKDGKRWVMAVYFPRGQKSFATIRKKFLSDSASARSNNTEGVAFGTNQELSLAERKQLGKSAAPIEIELYHLERITAILDSPPLAAVRKQFLEIDCDEPARASQVAQLKDELLHAQKHLESVQTGGDSYCYFMLYHFDLQDSFARDFVIIRRGEYPLYDLRIRIRDMDAGKDVVEKSWREINAPVDYLIVKWPLPPSVYYRVFFHARNGSWHQDLILMKSDAAQCRLAATQVLDKRGQGVIFKHVDNEFFDQFGAPAWRE